MEMVLVKYEIEKDKYDKMSKTAIENIVRWHSGRLINIEQKDNVAVLYMFCPSTWRLIIMNQLLLPYRYI